MQFAHVKILRRSLVGLIVLVLLAVSFNYIQTWRRRARALKGSAQILSADLVRAAEGLEYADHVDGRVRFKIRAKKLVETRAGKNLLQGIEAFDFNLDGTVRNRIRSRTAEYGKEDRRIHFIGDVRIDMGKDVELSTDSLQYDMKSNSGATDELLKLTSPQGFGTAKGVRYDHLHQTLEMLSEVNFTLNRVIRTEEGPTRTEPVHITSKRGRYSRETQIVRFEDSAQLESESASLSGNLIHAAFSDDGKQIKSLYSQGNSVYRSKDPANARTLLGDQINFGIAPETGALEHLDVRGNAAFSSSSGGAVQELRASNIHVELDPVKSLPLRLQSRDKVEFKASRDGQDSILTGDNLDASFVPQTDQMEKVRVWGGARMLSRKAAEATEDELEAEEIRISFTNTQGKAVVQELQAERSVKWKSSAKKSKSEGRALSANLLKLLYGAGDSLESGNASGNVILSGIPTGPSSGAQIRRLQADNTQFHFFPKENRLKDFEADGRVSIYYLKPGVSPDPPQEFQTSSSNMRATFREQDGTADTLSQWNNFVYKEGSRSALAGRGDYKAETEVFVLRESPKIIDESGTTTGEWMEYDRKKQILSVHKKVRSQLRPRSTDNGTPFGPSSDSASPSVVTADELQVWNEPARARYSGAVQMLSESGQLQARLLEIFGNGEKVEAHERVVHRIFRSEEKLQEKKPEDKKPKKKDPLASTVLIQSVELRYLKSQNSIFYSGQVSLLSGQVRMSSSSLDAVLGADGKAIDRAAARGNVVIRESGREARGEMADYFISPGKFVVTGKPAEISDPAKGKSFARRLTFFTADDRLLLENR